MSFQEPDPRRLPRTSIPLSGYISSLRFRITMLVITAILITLGTATLVIDYRVDDEVAQRADTNLLERAEALADIFRASGKDASNQLPFNWMPSFLADDGMVHFHITCDGRSAASSDEALSLRWPELGNGVRYGFGDVLDSRRTALRAIVLRFSPQLRLLPIEQGGRATMAYQKNEPGSCLLRLAVDRSEVLDFQQSMDHIELGCVVAGFLVVALLTPLLVKQGLRPLSGLAAEMEKIGPETPSMRLHQAGIHELSPLVTRFNEVLSRMEEGLLRERQVASGLAHELRTPLAELRTMIEVELRYPSGRDTSSLLAEVAEISKGMQRTVAALLMLTRIDAGIEKTQPEFVDVTALTRKLVERHKTSIRDRALSLQLEVAPGVIWWADPALLDVTLSNLLANAVAYTPEKSTVMLRCDTASWSVENPAPDLTAADVQLMRQRFWRKGKDAGSHTGLGLALAETAACMQSLRMELVLRSGSLKAVIHMPD